MLRMVRILRSSRLFKIYRMLWMLRTARIPWNLRMLREYRMHRVVRTARILWILWMLRECRMLRMPVVRNARIRRIDRLLRKAQDAD